MCNLDFKNKCAFTAFLIVLMALFVSLIVWISINIQEKVKTTENTITVSDTGTVYVKPDLALATASVITEKKTVAEAMNENTKKMNAVIEAVKAEGVESKDLKTTTFNISPRYEWYEASEIYPSGRRVLVGYEVTQSLEIKIRSLEKIGDIIAKATDAGANDVSNLQFTVDKQDEIKKQARDQAIEKAKAKAKDLASQLGIKLVRISSFSESGVIPYYYGLEKAMSSGLGGGEEAPSPQIETGENKIEVTVYLTYEIK
ncbi:MAG: hypothetical protein A2175_02045 [Candidatus Nealsonbacteria bacterium RBG_13_42_11]|uniref:26 kDa periplasmic immunogenic protein n=1 Tax=Candidatus Nealsonbacteria bacterium RBG_13_42_11 TaxID=1801663 RepID=A0A1G2E1F0_9BACT|nr:MAG: hypothetical protein A2175_02045 [Candidatus Nealsonbacteria bacterium RBG_13_42_11]